GELEHHHVKRFYARTNKIQFSFQTAQHERRRRLLQKIAKHQGKLPNKGTNLSLSFAQSDPLPLTNPTTCYHMSTSSRYFEDITTWLADLEDDPAFTNFLPKLKTYFLQRILEITKNGWEFTDGDFASITFQHNRIYCHKVVHFNYTTYDMCCNQDSCNPRTHADIMVFSRDPNDRAAHPYWFARIIGIFHVNAIHSSLLSKSARPQKFDILYVQWFGRAREQKQYGLHVN
ncbi:hypothetical protein GYMLUDRAFT_181641, partial [Collybiopsis luxurians FD-317 M1]